MKNNLYILLAFLALILSACQPDEPRDGGIEWGVRAAWQNGLGGTKPTRAVCSLSSTDILADGTDDIEIATADYPASINVHCSDGQNFTLTKGSASCTDHNEYWQYTPSIIYKDKKIERDNLIFTFSATIDDGDALTGTADKDAITTKTASAQRHMLVTLHHTKALLRFAFKVSDNYSKVRYIRVTGIQLNDSPCILVDKVLTTANQLIAYAYIDPAVVTVETVNNIECTYNIYDKDPSTGSGQVATDEHLTRKDVVAKNQFKLGSLKDKSSNPVTEIKPGYYYDLNVTLNPDYLYVLAEHDNKHLTIE